MSSGGWGDWSSYWRRGSNNDNTAQNNNQTGGSQASNQQNNRGSGNSMSADGRNSQQQGANNPQGGYNATQNNNQAGPSTNGTGGNANTAQSVGNSGAAGGATAAGNNNNNPYQNFGPGQQGGNNRGFGSQNQPTGSIGTMNHGMAATFQGTNAGGAGQNNMGGGNMNQMGGGMMGGSQNSNPNAMGAANSMQNTMSGSNQNPGMMGYGGANQQNQNAGSMMGGQGNAMQMQNNMNAQNLQQSMNQPGGASNQSTAGGGPVVGALSMSNLTQMSSSLQQQQQLSHQQGGPGANQMMQGGMYGAQNTMNLHQNLMNPDGTMPDQGSLNASTMSMNQNDGTQSQVGQLTATQSMMSSHSNVGGMGQHTQSQGGAAGSFNQFQYNQQGSSSSLNAGQAGQQFQYNMGGGPGSQLQTQGSATFYPAATFSQNPSGNNLIPASTTSGTAVQMGFQAPPTSTGTTASGAAAPEPPKKSKAFAIINPNTGKSISDQVKDDEARRQSKEKQEEGGSALAKTQSLLVGAGATANGTATNEQTPASTSADPKQAQTVPATPIVLAAADGGAGTAAPMATPGAPDGGDGPASTAGKREEAPEQPGSAESTGSKLPVSSTESTAGTSKLAKQRDMFAAFDEKTKGRSNAAFLQSKGLGLGVQTATRKDHKAFINTGARAQHHLQHHDIKEPHSKNGADVKSKEHIKKEGATSKAGVLDGYATLQEYMKAQQEKAHLPKPHKAAKQNKPSPTLQPQPVASGAGEQPPTSRPKPQQPDAALSEHLKEDAVHQPLAPMEKLHAKLAAKRGGDKYFNADHKFENRDDLKKQFMESLQKISRREKHRSSADAADRDTGSLLKSGPKSDKPATPSPTTEPEDGGRKAFQPGSRTTAQSKDTTLRTRNQSAKPSHRNDLIAALALDSEHGTTRQARRSVNSLDLHNKTTSSSSKRSNRSPLDAGGNVPDPRTSDMSAYTLGGNKREKKKLQNRALADLGNAAAEPGGGGAQADGKGQQTAQPPLPIGTLSTANVRAFTQGTGYQPNDAYLYQAGFPQNQHHMMMAQNNMHGIANGAQQNQVGMQQLPVASQDLTQGTEALYQAMRIRFDELKIPGELMMKTAEYCMHLVVTNEIDVEVQQVLANAPDNNIVQVRGQMMRSAQHRGAQLLAAWAVREDLFFDVKNPPTLTDLQQTIMDWYSRGQWQQADGTWGRRTFNEIIAAPMHTTGDVAPVPSPSPPTSIPVRDLTEEFQTQLHGTVEGMLQYNAQHMEHARKALDALMTDQLEWVKVFKNEQVLQTLFRSNHHVFSTWHPHINGLVNHINAVWHTNPNFDFVANLGSPHHKLPDMPGLSSPLDQATMEWLQSGLRAQQTKQPLQRLTGAAANGALGGTQQPQQNLQQQPQQMLPLTQQQLQIGLQTFQSLPQQSQQALQQMALNVLTPEETMFQQNLQLRMQSTPNYQLPPQELQQLHQNQYKIQMKLAETGWEMYRQNQARQDGGATAGGMMQGQQAQVAAPANQQFGNMIPNNGAATGTGATTQHPLQQDGAAPPALSPPNVNRAGGTGGAAMGGNLYTSHSVESSVMDPEEAARRDKHYPRDFMVQVRVSLEKAGKLSEPTVHWKTAKMASTGEYDIKRKTPSGSGQGQLSKVSSRGAGGQDWKKKKLFTDEADNFSSRADLIGVRNFSNNAFAGGNRGYGQYQQPNDLGLLKKTQNAYQVGHVDGSRLQQIKRQVQALLNKIAPDNLQVIVDQMAKIEIERANELDMVIELVYAKALNEDHYCQTYADMVYNLKTRYPEFPSEEDPTKKITFHRQLLTVCQDKYESCSRMLAGDEMPADLKGQELAAEMKKRRKHSITNMKFIGQLFLRQLLSVKVITSVIEDLIQLNSEEVGGPREDELECAVELLQTIGYTLESVTANAPNGEQQQGGNNGEQQQSSRLSNYFSKLRFLKTSKDEGGNYRYSKRCQFLIQDLLDLRMQGWRKKMLKEAAKKKEDMSGDLNDPNAARPFEFEIAGARPDYISAAKNQRADKGEQKDVDMKSVTKIITYFAEDDDKDEQAVANRLKKDFTDSVPPNMVEKALQIAVQYAQAKGERSGKVSSMFLALADKGACRYGQVGAAIGDGLANLHDTLMDEPQADQIFHVFFARCFTEVKNMGHFDNFFTELRDRVLVEDEGADMVARKECVRKVMNQVKQTSFRIRREQRELIDKFLVDLEP
ncbi:unnamed protein product [Amoebophrya sp. A120]|nr:unnamed protein product [Amoebophrya sp. A120]|eukprot:GSA120T00016777001.1